MKPLQRILALTTLALVALLFVFSTTAEAKGPKVTKKVWDLRSSLYHQVAPANMMLRRSTSILSMEASQWAELSSVFMVEQFPRSVLISWHGRRCTLGFAFADWPHF
jgi:hypothetical protein